MSKRDNVCSMQHTPISHVKNDVRTEWTDSILRSKEILTISHGLLEVLNVLRWKGPIQVVDIDPGVIEATKYLQEDFLKLKSRLNILTPICIAIQDLMPLYVAKRGVHNLGAVDIDLAFGIEEGADIAIPVVRTLAQAKFKGKILFTFCNGRDYTNGTEKRIRPLHQLCTKVGARVVSYRPYKSLHLESNAQRKVGSSMCIVEIQCGKVQGPATFDRLWT